MAATIKAPRIGASTSSMSSMFLAKMLVDQAFLEQVF